MKIRTHCLDAYKLRRERSRGAFFNIMQQGNAYTHPTGGVFGLLFFEPWGEYASGDFDTVTAPGGWSSFGGPTDASIVHGVNNVPYLGNKTDFVYSPQIAFDETKHHRVIFSQIAIVKAASGASFHHPLFGMESDGQGILFNMWVDIQYNVLDTPPLTIILQQAGGTITPGVPIAGYVLGTHFDIQIDIDAARNIIVSKDGVPIIGPIAADSPPDVTARGIEIDTFIFKDTGLDKVFEWGPISFYGFAKP